MDHYNHHGSATFEGEYMRFSLPSGASLVIIICVVHSTDRNPVNVNVTYVPADSGPIWQRDFWPAELEVQASDASQDFVLSASLQGGDGSSAAAATKDDRVSVNLNSRGGRVSLRSSCGLAFNAEIHSHTPWSKTSSSPEGWFINLPLPLHWHVLSAYSPCTVTLRLPETYATCASATSQAELGAKVSCIAHFEKNWAIGFPAAHVWIQGHHAPGNAPATTAAAASRLPPQPGSRPQPHLLTIAGGPIMGMEAYLVGYRNSARNISLDFRPPFTLSLVPSFWSLLDMLPGFISQAFDDHPVLERAVQSVLNPFTRVNRNWESRSMQLSFSDPLRGWRVDIQADATEEGSGGFKPFYNLWAPYPAGFKEKWMAQCLHASANVKVYRRRFGWARDCFPWTWDLVCEDRFENVGFEFGGEYYPERGVQTRTTKKDI